MEFHHIAPLDGDMDVETEGSEDHPASPDPPIWFEVMFFLLCFCFKLLWIWTVSCLNISSYIKFVLVS